MPAETGRQIAFPEYENFLTSLKKKGGPFKFVTDRKHFPVGSKVGTAPKARSLAEVRKSVLESPRVKSVISEECLRRACASEDVRKEAEEILDEMSHTFNLYNVRSFGYAVCKAMEKLYDGIYVNEQKLLEIRERSKKDCVIFMPSHKTYFDFLLLSLICFRYDIQLPAIAAGQDFMSMKFMAGVLRRSGAFFMRRSFGTDQLYWAVFSEYVQSHVVNNDRTVEFFVEATRSRVGKSLHPKYGMLQMVLEPYLRGSVFDLVIVPVSMNYDKILEEKLYAYELLGFPKPKESTGGLLKAREILNNNHGSCFLTFGDPISVREYFGTTLHRGTFVCQPDSQFVLDSQAKMEIKKFAHHVVETHNKNAVITVWSVASMVILQTLDRDDQSILTYSGVYSGVEDFITLLNRLGAVVNIDKNLDKTLRYYLKMHDDLFEPFDVESEEFNLKFIDFPVAHQKPEVPKSLMERAVSRLILTTYSNGMIHAVDSEGILCQLVLNSGEKCHVAKTKEEFRWLHDLMKREFVTIPGEIDALFEKTLEILTSSGILECTDDGVLEILDTNEARVLSKLVLPYFYNFELAFKTFNDNRPMMSNLSEVVGTVQKNISDAYQNRLPNTRLSFLSTEPIKNAFSALTDFGAFEKSHPIGTSAASASNGGTKNKRIKIEKGDNDEDELERPARLDNQPPSKFTLDPPSQKTKSRSNAVDPDGPTARNPHLVFNPDLLRESRIRAEKYVYTGIAARLNPLKSSSTESGKEKGNSSTTASVSDPKQGKKQKKVVSSDQKTASASTTTSRAVANAPVDPMEGHSSLASYHQQHPPHQQQIAHDFQNQPSGSQMHTYYHQNQQYGMPGSSQMQNQQQHQMHFDYGQPSTSSNVGHHHHHQQHHQQQQQQPPPPQQQQQQHHHHHHQNQQFHNQQQHQHQHQQQQQHYDPMASQHTIRYEAIPPPFSAPPTQRNFVPQYPEKTLDSQMAYAPQQQARNPNHSSHPKTHHHQPPPSAPPVMMPRKTPPTVPSQMKRATDAQEQQRLDYEVAKNVSQIMSKNGMRVSQEPIVTAPPKGHQQSTSMSTSTSKPAGDFRCPSCDRSMSNQRNLQRHMSSCGLNTISSQPLPPLHVPVQHQSPQLAAMLQTNNSEPSNSVPGPSSAPSTSYHSHGGGNHDPIFSPQYDPMRDPLADPMAFFNNGFELKDDPIVYQGPSNTGDVWPHDDSFNSEMQTQPAPHEQPMDIDTLCFPDHLYLGPDQLAEKKELPRDYHHEHDDLVAQMDPSTSHYNAFPGFDMGMESVQMESGQMEPVQMEPVQMEPAQIQMEPVQTSPVQMDTVMQPLTLDVDEPPPQSDSPPVSSSDQGRDTPMTNASSTTGGVMVPAGVIKCTSCSKTMASERSLRRHYNTCKLHQAEVQAGTKIMPSKRRPAANRPKPVAKKTKMSPESFEEVEAPSSSSVAPAPPPPVQQSVAQARPQKNSAILAALRGEAPPLSHYHRQFQAPLPSANSSWFSSSASASTSGPPSTVFSPMSSTSSSAPPPQIPHKSSPLEDLLNEVSPPSTTMTIVHTEEDGDSRSSCGTSAKPAMTPTEFTPVAATIAAVASAPAPAPITTSKSREQVSCDYCKRQLASQSNLKRHLATCKAGKAAQEMAAAKSNASGSSSENPVTPTALTPVSVHVAPSALPPPSHTQQQPPKQTPTPQTASQPVPTSASMQHQHHQAVMETTATVTYTATNTTDTWTSNEKGEMLSPKQKTSTTTNALVTHAETSSGSSGPLGQGGASGSKYMTVGEALRAQQHQNRVDKEQQQRDLLQMQFQQQQQTHPKIYQMPARIPPRPPNPILNQIQNPPQQVQQNQLQNQMASRQAPLTQHQITTQQLPPLSTEALHQQLQLQSPNSKKGVIEHKNTDLVVITSEPLPEQQLQQQQQKQQEEPMEPLEKRRASEGQVLQHHQQRPVAQQHSNPHMSQTQQIPQQHHQNLNQQPIQHHPPAQQNQNVHHQNPQQTSHQQRMQQIRDHPNPQQQHRQQHQRQQSALPPIQLPQRQLPQPPHSAPMYQANSQSQSRTLPSIQLPPKRPAQTVPMQQGVQRMMGQEDYRRHQYQQQRQYQMQMQMGRQSQMSPEEIQMRENHQQRLQMQHQQQMARQQSQQQHQQQQHQHGNQGGRMQMPNQMQSFPNQSEPMNQQQNEQQLQFFRKRSLQMTLQDPEQHRQAEPNPGPSRKMSRTEEMEQAEQHHQQQHMQQMRQPQNQRMSQNQMHIMEQKPQNSLGFRMSSTESYQQLHSINEEQTQPKPATPETHERPKSQDRERVQESEPVSSTQQEEPVQQPAMRRRANTTIVVEHPRRDHSPMDSYITSIPLSIDVDSVKQSDPLEHGQNSSAESQVSSTTTGAPSPTPSTASNSDVALARSSRSSRKKQPYICPECNNTYSCRKNVKRHRMAVHKLSLNEVLATPEEPAPESPESEPERVAGGGRRHTVAGTETESTTIRARVSRRKASAPTNRRQKAAVRTSPKQQAEQGSPKTIDEEPLERESASNSLLEQDAPSQHSTEAQMTPSPTQAAHNFVNMPLTKALLTAQPAHREPSPFDAQSQSDPSPSTIASSPLAGPSQVRRVVVQRSTAAPQSVAPRAPLPSIALAPLASMAPAPTRSMAMMVPSSMASSHALPPQVHIFDQNKSTTDAIQASPPIRHQRLPTEDVSTMVAATSTTSDDASDAPPTSSAPAAASEDDEEKNAATAAIAAHLKQSVEDYPTLAAFGDVMLNGDDEEEEDLDDDDLILKQILQGDNFLGDDVDEFVQELGDVGSLLLDDVVNQVLGKLPLTCSSIGEGSAEQQELQQPSSVEHVHSDQPGPSCQPVQFPLPQFEIEGLENIDQDMFKEMELIHQPHLVVEEQTERPAVQFTEPPKKGVPCPGCSKMFSNSFARNRHAAKCSLIPRAAHINHPAALKLKRRAARRAVVQNFIEVTATLPPSPDSTSLSDPKNDAVQKTTTTAPAPTVVPDVVREVNTNAVVPETSVREETDQLVPPRSDEPTSSSAPNQCYLCPACRRRFTVHSTMIRHIKHDCPNLLVPAQPKISKHEYK